MLPVHTAKVDFNYCNGRLRFLPGTRSLQTSLNNQATVPKTHQCPASAPSARGSFLVVHSTCPGCSAPFLPSLPWIATHRCRAGDRLCVGSTDFSWLAIGGLKLYSAHISSPCGQ